MHTHPYRSHPAAAVFLAALVASVATSPPRNWAVQGFARGAPFTLNDAAPEATTSFQVEITAETFADPALPAVDRSLLVEVDLQALDGDAPAEVELALVDAHGEVVVTATETLLVGADPDLVELDASALLDGCGAEAECVVPVELVVTRVTGGLVYGDWRVQAFVGGDQVEMPDGAALELLITAGGES